MTISLKGDAINLSITASTKQNKITNNYYFIEKIMEVLGNDRMLDKVCDEYIGGLKTKYISIAKVFSIIRKSNNKGTWASIVSKSNKVDYSSMSELLLASNLPLTEMDIILNWAEQISSLKAPS